jgi:hypothetical protein
MAYARGHVYVVGGEPETGPPTRAVEVAKLERNGTLSPWRETTPLPTPLERHAAVSFVPP